MSLAYRHAEHSQDSQVVLDLSLGGRVTQLRNDLAQGEAIALPLKQGENGSLALAHLPLDSPMDV